MSQAAVVDGDDEEVTVRLTEAEAQADLVGVLQLCAAGSLRCSEKTRRPSAATVSVVAETLASQDFYPDDAIAAFAWPLLIQAGGLAELAGGRLQLTSRGRAALTSPPSGTLRLLWQRWISNGLIDELGRIEAIKGQRSANTLTAVKPRRQAVAAALTACPPGDWVPIDQFFTTMRHKGLSPTVARNDRSIWKLYIAEPEYGSLGYAGFHDWAILEGRYTLCVLFEYAATLGLIDVFYTDPGGARDDFGDNWGTDDLDYLSRYDGLTAIRLNALGGYVLGLTGSYEPAAHSGPPDRVLRVLPNLDVVVTGQLATADRLLLDAFATRSSDRVWSLTMATLTAAVDACRPLDELRRFLTSRGQQELPDAVTALLDDVTGRASRLADLGVARVIECADPALATLLARDRTLGKLCRPLGERHIAVPVEHEASFRRALLALGYALPSRPGTPP